MMSAPPAYVYSPLVEGTTVEVAACIPARLQEQRDLEEGQEVEGVQTRSSRVERSH